MSKYWCDHIFSPSETIAGLAINPTKYQPITDGIFFCELNYKYLFKSSSYGTQKEKLCSFCSQKRGWFL